MGVHVAPRIVPPVFHQAPTIVRPHTNARAPVVLGRGAAFARGGRRSRDGTGLGVLGFDGAGFGLSTAGDLLTPGFDAPLPPPRIIPADVPAPCAKPLIISIGHGLRHVARTRVVYGAPPACGP